MSKLLINEQPLQVLPSLAQKIGLNEAIVLQQIHWLLNCSKHQINGRAWLYNTYEQWQENHFPFWSVETVKRTILSLEKQGLLLSTTSFNRMKVDKTKWYSIDYVVLMGLDYPTEDFTRPSGQNDPSSRSNCPDVTGQIDPTNNQEIIQENTTRDHNHPNPPKGGLSGVAKNELIELFAKTEFSSFSAESFHDEVENLLKLNGFDCCREHPVENRGDGRKGKIDLFVQKYGEGVGIELDNEVAREKSAFKLNQVKPNDGLIILRNGFDERNSLLGITVINARRKTQINFPKNQPKQPEVDYQSIADLYNQANEQTGSRLPMVSTLNDRRKRAIKKFLAAIKQPTLACAEKYFEVFFDDLKPHHLGENDRGWRATFDFAIRDDIVLRVREGAL